LFFFNFVDRFTVLRFTATEAPLAAKNIRILLMNQHAYGRYRLELREVINLVDCLTALFQGERCGSWVGVHDFSAAGSSYQLH
jgi:hypothetical protein